MSSGSYGEYRPAQGTPVVQYHVGENPPQQYNLDTKSWQTPSNYLGAAGGTNASDTFHYPLYSHHAFDVGIFRDTLAPSLALHSTLATVAWGVGRSLDRVDAKDWLWPSAMVANTWWSAVGHRVFLDGTPLATVGRTISWTERLLLAGVTVWGGRLFYRVVTKTMTRGGDDARYAEIKKEEGYWNKALLNTFLPEALFQTIITLPMVGPFRHRGAVFSGYHPIVQSIAVGMFSAGFVLETLADTELATYKKDASAQHGILKTGVWSIVRHPNYLGDVLLHASFPLLLFSSDMLAPVELLGPIANYFYLRYIGGDQETEAYQEARYQKEDPVKFKELKQYQQEKNSVWPDLQEIQNPALWTVIGAGVAGVVLERLAREFLH